jgi:hypothetical protein
MERPSKEELLKQNSQIDPDSLDEATRLADQLKESGVQGARYSLATPATRRRLRISPADQTHERHSHSLVRRH